MTPGGRRLLASLLCAAHLLGCGLLQALPVTPAPRPTVLATPWSTPTALPSATPVNPDSGWIPLREGMAQRILNIQDEEGKWVESITILRLEASRFSFDVAYAPGAPQSLQEWQEEREALLVVNGGFFTEENVATGLVVSGGERFGSSYEGFGGMFAVTESGPQVRWLVDQPYNMGEPLLAALQAFPMLLTPGGVAAVTQEDGQRARRTVVAQDGEGRVYFLVANQGAFTLFGLSQYLAQSDMGLVLALNLDGGASSGLLLSEPPLHVPALSLLPAVIVVHER